MDIVATVAPFLQELSKALKDGRLTKDQAQQLLLTKMAALSVWEFQRGKTEETTHVSLMLTGASLMLTHF